MNERLAQPPTEAERAASRKAIDALHPGNRFRLMFGQPLFPQPEWDAVNPGQRREYERQRSVQIQQQNEQQQNEQPKNQQG